jgi:hypothetical protein
MKELFVQIPMSRYCYDIVSTGVLWASPVVSLYEMRDGRTRLITRRQGQRDGLRPAAEESPSHRARPSKDFRGREKVSSISLSYRPPPYSQFISLSFPSRADSSTQFHSFFKTCGPIFKHLQARMILDPPFLFVQITSTGHQLRTFLRSDHAFGEGRLGCFRFVGWREA